MNENKNQNPTHTEFHVVSVTLKGSESATRDAGQSKAAFLRDLSKIKKNPRGKQPPAREVTS